MDAVILRAFADELEKIARVHPAVKQYRRALMALRPGIGTSRKGVPQAFHGTEDATKLRSILKDMHLEQSPTGVHGRGAYMWRDAPLSAYMSTPDAPHNLGLIYPRSKALVRANEVPTQALGEAARKERQRMIVWRGDSPTDKFPLPADTTVVAPRHAAEDLLRAKKLRSIDPALFHRAEADLRAANTRRMLGDTAGLLERPSKKELIETAKRRPTFKKLRAATRGGKEDFLEGFEDVV